MRLHGAVIHGCECGAGGDAPGDDGEAAGGGGGGGGDDAGAEEEEEAAAPVRNFVTVVPAPWRADAARAPHLAASHFWCARLCVCKRFTHTPSHAPAPPAT